MPEKQNLIADALRLAEQGRQFPGWIYTSPELHQLENKRIFRADWQMVAREEELANPGDYQVQRIAGESILITRDKDGVLQAFHNLCLHRGAEVARGFGNARSFVCPYHNWSYQLDGRLIGIPLKEDIKNFDSSDHQLVRVRLETWGGFIFINLDQNARALKDAYEEVLRRCAFIRAADLQTAWKFDLEVNCNWKLVIENLYDVYHLNVVHRNSFARDFDPHNFRLQTMSGGMFFGEYRSQSLGTPDGKTLFRSIPWFPGDDKLAFGAQILPALTLVGRHDALYALVAVPLNHERCRLTTYMLMPQDWFSEPDFKARANRYEEFMKLILAEDLDLLASLQLGAASEAYVPGPASDLESPVLHLTKNILTRLSDQTPQPGGRSTSL